MYLYAAALICGVGHDRALETDQPQALSLCAARGDRADRKGRCLRAHRYRSRQKAGLVPCNLAARQDAGAAGRRCRDFRIRGHPGISRGDPAPSAASGRSLETRRASRLDRIRVGCPQRHRWFYAAADEATFKAKTVQLERRFARLETRVQASPWFNGESFSLVDAVFGPVFRYFDVFDGIGDFGILAGKPKLTQLAQLEVCFCDFARHAASQIKQLDSA